MAGRVPFAFKEPAIVFKVILEGLGVVLGILVDDASAGEPGIAGRLRKLAPGHFLALRQGRARGLPAHR
jgi:hypothetical protein